MPIDLNTAVELLESAVRQIVRDELARLRERTSAHAEYLTTREAADVARVSIGTVRRWRREGRIKAVGAGTRLRFLHDDVLKMMRDDGKRQSPVTKTKRRAHDVSPEEQVAQMGYA